MNRQEFEDTARRYREELFRMYAGQNMCPPPKPPQGNRPVLPPPMPPQGNRPAPPPPMPPQGNRPVPPPPMPPQGNRPVPPPPKPPQGNRPVPPPPMPPQGNRPVPPPPMPPQGNRPVPPPPMPPQENRPVPPPPMPRVMPAMAATKSLPEQIVPDEAILSTPAEPIEIEPDTVDSAPEESAARDSNAPKSEYTGVIRVHVVTAQGARPVAGASVIISQLWRGEPELVSLQTTDQNGNIEAVTVPAPPPSADQRRPESYLYDITAQAAGYYREHSTDVPVFPDTTSIQNFDMIPLPAGVDEPTPDGDLTFYNDMQQY